MRAPRDELNTGLRVKRSQWQTRRRGKERDYERIVLSTRAPVPYVNSTSRRGWSRTICGPLRESASLKKRDPAARPTSFLLTYSRVSRSRALCASLVYQPIESRVLNGHSIDGHRKTVEKSAKSEKKATRWPVLWKQESQPPRSS